MTDKLQQEIFRQVYQYLNGKKVKKGAVPLWPLAIPLLLPLAPYALGAWLGTKTPLFNVSSLLRNPMNKALLYEAILNKMQDRIRNLKQLRPDLFEEDDNND